MATRRRAVRRPAWWAGLLLLFLLALYLHLFSLTPDPALAAPTITPDPVFAPASPLLLLSQVDALDGLHIVKVGAGPAHTLYIARNEEDKEKKLLEKFAVLVSWPQVRYLVVISLIVLTVYVP